MSNLTETERFAEIQRLAESWRGPEHLAAQRHLAIELFEECATRPILITVSMNNSLALYHGDTNMLEKAREYLSEICPLPGLVCFMIIFADVVMYSMMSHRYAVALLTGAPLLRIMEDDPSPRGYHYQTPSSLARYADRTGQLMVEFGPVSEDRDQSFDEVTFTIDSLGQEPLIALSMLERISAFRHSQNDWLNHRYITERWVRHSRLRIIGQYRADLSLDDWVLLVFDDIFRDYEG